MKIKVICILLFFFLSLLIDDIEAKGRGSGGRGRGGLCASNIVWITVILILFILFLCHVYWEVLVRYCCADPEPDEAAQIQEFLRLHQRLQELQEVISDPPYWPHPYERSISM